MDFANKRGVFCCWIIAYSAQVQYDDIDKQLEEMAEAEGIDQSTIKYGENQVITCKDLLIKSRSQVRKPL